MSVPSMDEGMADLPTLAKIFEVLSTSQNVKNNDDKDLASWIQANYLTRDFDGVIRDGSIAIKNTEDFAKLYNAYKRVRNLTNRTQDKWPFFNRWKSMTSAQVTKMATSDSIVSPSVTPAAFPLKSSSVHESGDDGKLVSATSKSASGMFLPHALLAVESASEHSNLDDLPTRKRALDFDERGRFARGHGNLRKRGRRGGKVGCLHGKKSLAAERADSTDEVNGHTPSIPVVSTNNGDTEMVNAPVKKPKATASSPRATRRQMHVSRGNDAQDLAVSAQVGKFHAGSDTTVDDKRNFNAPQADKGAAAPHEVNPSDLTDTEQPKPEPAESMTKFDQDTGKLDSTMNSLKKTVGQDVHSRFPYNVFAVVAKWAPSVWARK
ncbi:hypothetical protein PMIN01_13421 [Paraphaeosphaeria minitans]|uniref:Uncharacterized protein n=1 Tax=Paraphaeosphaeria minitans TaxID=565426 RepID=A0A9P6G4Z3_9PLEO|nr:hypothetical protein PMIN01_13421 [Paraphaeosphaeria minitans]